MAVTELEKIDLIRERMGVSYAKAKEALDAADIEIPFPHQVAVPYGEDDIPEALPAPRARKGRGGDATPADAPTDTASEG